jgi:hypothetical protein
MRTLSTTLVAVSITTIRKAEQGIACCQSCDRTADVPFSCVLDRVTDRDGAITDYFMSEPARCPNCRAAVIEDTLVERI